MQTICEADTRGVFTGQIQEIADDAECPRGWVAAAAPDLWGEQVAQWVGSRWAILNAAPTSPTAERRMVPKSVIISRLTDQQVANAIAMLTPKQAERWRAPDKPAVYFDDAETLAIIDAVGADPAVIMAPPEG